MSATDNREPFCVTRLIEIASTDPAVTANELCTQLHDADDQVVRLISDPGEQSWILLETHDMTVADLLRLLPAGATGTELRRRIHFDASSIEAIGKFIAEARRIQAVVAGRVAIERAIQRRRLDMLILPVDLDPNYLDAVERIVNTYPRHIQIITCALTMRELGQSAGIKRAGCLGLVRGYQQHNLCSRRVDVEAASSHPRPACPHRRTTVPPQRPLKP